MNYTAPQAELVLFKVVSVILESDPYADDDRLPDIDMIAEEAETQDTPLKWE